MPVEKGGWPTVAAPGMHLCLKITLDPAKSILGISAFFTACH